MKRYSMWLLQGLVVVVLLANVWTNLRQREELRRLGNALNETRQSLAAKRLLRGDPIEQIEVLDRAGAPRLLSARDGIQRLVVVVDPRCDSCAETARQLVREKTRMPVWVISVADVAATRRFADDHRLGDAVYSLSPRNFPLLRQKLTGNPQIVRLDGAGLVAKTCGSVRDCLE